MASKIRNFRKTFDVLKWIRKEVFLIALTCLIILHLSDYIISREKKYNYKQLSKYSCIYNANVIRFFEKRKHWLTSNSGSILFKNQPLKYNQQNRTFNVLIWKHPFWINMYLNNPYNTSKICSVNNCRFTSNDTLIETVDAVVISPYKAQLPKILQRNASQIWIFQSIESPINTFIGAKMKLNTSIWIESMADIFNWSMTYRSDSDVPIPYGRTVPLPENLVLRATSEPITKSIPYWDSKQRDVLVAAMISNCNIPERMDYINELQKYIKVDLYGNCATTIEKKIGCPGHSLSDCPKINNYFFYLAFENSRCRQYLTEKVFHSSFSKGAIPVVMGAPVSDYEKLLPPYSFLHVDSFGSPRDLAMEILNLSANDDYLVMYHKWRYYFKIVNEHGFLGSKSYALCRLCEALNYNDNETKLYDLDALKLYLDPKLLCTIPVNSTPRSRLTKTTRSWKRPKFACQKRILKTNK